MLLLPVVTRSTVLAALLAVWLLPAALFMPGAAGAAEMPAKTTIRLGVMEGDELEVWQAAVVYAREKEGLNIVLVPFSEYILPNEALNNGDLDANAFQHRPYLEAQIAQRDYKITPAGDTCLYPLGAYSRRVKKLEDLPAGATIGIPDDPSNEGRALRLLAQKGLISLDDPANILVTPINIRDNPKKLQFQEMDSGILGRAIGDMDLVIVTNSWVSATGLNPATELIAAESPANNPYVNFIAVRSEDTGKPWVKKLVASYQNEVVRRAIQRVFGRRAIIPW